LSVVRRQEAGGSPNENIFIAMHEREMRGMREMRRIINYS
jgi:hypothetical protein